MESFSQPARWFPNPTVIGGKSGTLSVESEVLRFIPDGEQSGFSLPLHDIKFTKARNSFIFVHMKEGKTFRFGVGGAQAPWITRVFFVVAMIGFLSVLLGADSPIVGLLASMSLFVGLILLTVFASKNRAGSELATKLYELLVTKSG